ncbi:Nuf2 family protein [Spironucleus salmonicida]|uniref:Nuf2 family protein n=1 Tax=Spironucleus salmonicida TaxID=348837 RepID=V6LXF4_9EUKA|nr:Nuf2 family protein [Spironucleus salmonicida]|eukprot:EST49312.1 Nuf2 family protein [Spironucleus salmonicida]
MFRFPILKVRELNDILQEIDFDDPQIVMEPSKTITQELFTYIIHLLQINPLADFKYDLNLNAKALPILTIFYQTSKLLNCTDVPDFSILDLVLPQKNRLQVHLSAIFNFIRQQQRVHHLILTHYQNVEINFQQIKFLQTEKKHKVQDLNEFIAQEERFRPLLKEVNGVLTQCQIELKTSISALQTVTCTYLENLALRDSLISKQAVMKAEIDRTIKGLQDIRNDGNECYADQVKSLELTHQKDQIGLKIRNLAEEICGKMQLHTGMRELHQIRSKMKEGVDQISSLSGKVDRLTQQNGAMSEQIEALKDGILAVESDSRNYQLDAQIQNSEICSERDRNEVQGQVNEILDNLSVERAKINKMASKVQAIPLKKNALCEQMCSQFNELVKGVVVQAQESEISWVSFLEQEKRYLSDN